MGLGVFEEGLYPSAVLRRTGAAATGTDRTVLAFLGGEVCMPLTRSPPAGPTWETGPRVDPNGGTSAWPLDRNDPHISW